MDIQIFTWARYAEFGPDGSINIIGGAKDLQQVPSLPHTLPWFYVVTRIFLTKKEAEEIHSVKYELFNPDGVKFVSSEDAIIDQRKELPANREFLHAHSALVLSNFVLTKEGYYRIQLQYDGSIVKEATFRVEEQSQSIDLPELKAQGGRP